MRDAAFADVPLALHARYTRDEVLSALGRSTLAKSFTQQTGVFCHEPTRTDYFFVTLERSEKHYSPSTRYRALRHPPRHLQLGIAIGHPRRKRHRSTLHPPHPTRQPRHALRPAIESNKDAWGRTQPFTFLGPASYVSHTGERPMAIMWRLHRAMPMDVFKVARVAAG